MNRFFDWLKSVPWTQFSLISLGMITILSLLDYILIWIASQSVGLKNILQFILTPPLGVLTPVLTSLAIGALGVYIIETYFSQIYIDQGRLWAISLCIWLAWALKVELLNVPSLFTSKPQIILICIILGVFWKGRYYWMGGPKRYN